MFWGLYQVCADPQLGSSGPGTVQFCVQTDREPEGHGETAGEALACHTSYSV